MANFAKLNADNLVLEVITVDNKELLDDQGKECEQYGIAFLTLLTRHIHWRQTSYNGNFRKNFARPGDTYDPVRDAFIAPKPYPSWQLDESTCCWQAPIPRPSQPADHYTNPGYLWNEESQAWQDCSYKTDGYFEKPVN